ncbi:MAG TPA: DUF559 domain-containing protein [Amycolatopsis sp.]|nr:DUF559 domain-containing protein [Amycolatopsis sp.]
MLLSHRPHGAYLRSEILSVIGRRALDVALREGRLVAFSKAVLIDASRAVDFRTRAAAALLYVGDDGTLVGPSALALHGCTAAELAPIHVRVPFRRHARAKPGVVVHQTRVVQDDSEERDGLRLVTLDRAVADYLCRGRRHSAMACTEQAIGALPDDQREPFRALIGRRLDSLSDQRGCRQAWFLLDLCRGLSESPAESWTLLNLVDGGLPVPVQQYRLSDISGNEIYRLDFAWPELRIAVEYDGYEAHLDRRERDELREADLKRRGWLVIRSGSADLKDPSRLVNAVRQAFRQRGIAA